MRISDWSSDVCSSDLLVNCILGSGADQNCYLFASIEHLCGAMQVDIGGNHGGRGPAHARKDCPMLSGRLLHRQVLQIIGEDKGGDPPVAKRYAHRPVSTMTDLRRNGRRRYKRTGHVLEHRLQIKFLLVMGD